MRRDILLLGVILAGVGSISYAAIDEKFQALQAKPDQLYTFLKQMPKGGELHYHFDGALDTQTLLEQAKSSSTCIHPTTFTAELCEHPQATSIQDVMNNKPMFHQLTRAWSMNDLVPHQELARDHFFSIFPKITAIYGNQALKGPLLAKILQKAAEQHELYMEIMALSLNEDDYYVSLIQNEKDLIKKLVILLTNRSFQRNIDRLVKQSKTFVPAAHAALNCDKQHSAACDIQVGFQFYVRRVKSIDSIFVQAVAGFVAAENSDNIVGLNLVDREDAPIAQRDYEQQMKIFAFLHKYYPYKHISLHAGELYPKSVADHLVTAPIRDAIMIGQAERIGHGLDILEEPNPNNLADLMAKKSIAVEVNLSSNRLIYGVKGKQHPLKFYLQHQVPVILSTDDEGILNTELTNEYVQAVRYHHIDYATLKQINRNSLTYGFMLGTSIWTNAAQAIRIPECQELLSKQCLNYIENNPKAHLQWQLEQNLIKFEQAWQ